MEWAIVGIGALLVLMLMGAGELILVGAIGLLGYQTIGWLKTGVWPKYTVSSEFDVTGLRFQTDWVIIDRALSYVIFDMELALVMVGLYAIVAPLRAVIDTPAARKLPKGEKEGT